MNKLKLSLLMMVLSLAMSGCNIQAPKTTFKEYKIDNVTFSKTDMRFIFEVENPNQIPISIVDISYSIDLDGSNVVKGTSEGFSLQSKEAKETVFPIEIVYSKMLGQAGNLVRKFVTRDGTVAYNVTGELTVKDNFGMSAKVPIASQGDIKLF